MIENWERRQAYKSINLDLSLIDNIEIEGVDWKDCPDFCDAFISSADYDGRPMTDDELDWLNEQNDFRYEAVYESLH